MSDRYGGAMDLRALRVLTIVLPVAFVLGLELVRQVAADESTQARAVDLTLLGLLLVGIVAFSAMVFRIVGRTQAQLARRNRELAAANDVSQAVRGALDLEEVLDASLDAVLAATGASEATIVRSARDARWAAGSRVVRRRTAHPSNAAADTDGRTREIPLTTGATTVGTLRLRFAALADPDDELSSETLDTIAQQLAGAIQTAELLADLQRGMREGHAFYDVLLQVSNQNPLPDTIAAILQHCRNLMRADAAVITLNAATVRSLLTDGELVGATPLGDGSMCVTSDPGHAEGAHQGALVCPLRSDPSVKQSYAGAVRGPDGAFGDLWLGRHDDQEFDDKDARFLATRGEITSIAIANARLFERERQGAIVEERERIAREMHDGMAQVLGVTHLRLRALEASPDVRELPGVHDEISSLADLCLEAYSDVRESILGLHEASRVDRALMESLRAYLEKYSKQSGIPTRLEADPDHEVVLPTRYQVQVLRVVQEALTNVRKHSGASSAVVSCFDDGTSTVVTVADDGHGFEMAGLPEGREGFGLHSMRERMELLGGTLTLDSAPGRGTRVVATVPSPNRNGRTTEAARAGQ
jgi:two-component system nitrate/nitrite sensor histidine kinase NarX